MRRQCLPTHSLDNVDRLQLVLHENGLQGRGEVEYWPEVISGPWWSYRLAWFLPPVFLPHAASVVAGLLLLHLGYHGVLGKMRW
jgi:hypothetical protein